MSEGWQATKRGLLLAILSVPFTLYGVLTSFIAPVGFRPHGLRPVAVAQYQQKLESLAGWYRLDPAYHWGFSIFVGLIGFLLFCALYPRFTLSEAGQESPDDLNRVLSHRLSLNQLVGLIIAGLLSLMALPLPVNHHDLLPYEKVLLGGIPYYSQMLFMRVLGNPFPVGFVFSSILSGAMLWSCWSSSGLLRAETTPRSFRRLVATLLRGAAAGGVIGVAVLPATEWARTILRILGREAFGIHQLEALPAVMVIVAAMTALGYFIMGSVGYALALETTPTLRRWRLLRAPVALAVVSAALQWSLYHGVLVTRYDYGKSLRQTIGRPAEDFRPYTMVLFTGARERPALGFTKMRSIQDVEVTDRSVRLCRELLARHRGASCLASPAYVHLHDASSLRWDPVESLRIDRECLTTNPSRIFVDLLIERLLECPVTPETKAYLDWIADEKAWHHSRRTAGLLTRLYYEFGDMPRYQTWRKRSGQTDPPPRAGTGSWTTRGEIRGKVLVNDRPLTNALVGVVSVEDMRSLTGEQRPFEQRHVVCGVRTKSDGAFILSHLRNGEYYLVVKTLAEDIPGDRDRLFISNAPSAIAVSGKRPTTDVGSVRILKTEPGEKVQSA